MKKPKTLRPEKIGELMTAIVPGLATFIAVIFASVLAFADVNVTGTVDRNSLNPDDTLTLTVSVDASDEVSVGQPTLSPMNDFEILNEWTSQSQQASMVSTPNGPQFRKVYSLRYNYMLQPKRQGNLAIGGVEVVVDGKSFRTKPIAVKVAPGAGAQSAPRGRGGQRAQPPGGGGAFPPDIFNDEEDDLFSQLLRRVRPPGAGQGSGSGGSRTLPVNPQDAFFIQVETDKSEAYVGEQITVSFFLYTRGLIRDLDTLKYPALKGFWKEDIELATHLNFEEEIVNGIPYKKALLASFALFPIKEGSATIDPYQAKCSVIPAVDAFGGLGLGKAYTFTKSSQPVKITVKPLPTEGRPTDFSGAVGEFQVSSRVEDRNIVDGQPFTLKVRFEGRGNAKLIDIPPMQLPEGLELYDNQNEARFYRTGTSFKEFKVLMIPRREGDFTIPAIGTSVFDPRTRTYVRKQTEPITIHVGKNAGAKAESMPMKDGGSNSGAGGESARKAPEEPRLITEFKETSKISSTARAALWTAVFAAILLTLLWRARLELGWGERKKDLMRQLKTRLRKVDAKVAAGDWRGVGAEMTNTVYFVLGTISGEKGANMELEKLLLKAPPSVRRELAEPIAKHMEYFQILTFAPESVVGALKESQKMRESIGEMERLMTKAVSLGLSAEGSSERGGAFEPGPRAS